MAKTKQPTAPILAPLEVGEDGLPLSSCRVCGSTKREKYVESTQEVIDGKLYRWLRTKCLDCGQRRLDRLVEEFSEPAKDRIDGQPQSIVETAVRTPRFRRAGSMTIVARSAAL